MSGATFAALFVAVLAIWIVSRVVEVLLLVFLAVLVAVYLSAITDLLERRFRVPRWAGLICAVAGTLAVVVGSALLILPPVVDQTQALLSGLPQTLATVQSVLASWASQYPVLRHNTLADPNSGLVARLIGDAANFLQGSLLPYLRAGGKLVIETLSVLVMGLYLARNPEQYRSGIVSLVAPRYRQVANTILMDAAATLRAWVVGQLLDMLVLGVLAAIGLLVLNVPYWLAFGALAAVAAIVPFFGTIVSTVLPALFVVGTGSALRVVAVLLVGVVVHVIEANLVAPLIMEKKVSLPPVLTIASVLAMGALFGMIGLIVAVPVLSVAMVLIQHVILGAIYGDRTESAVLRTTERRLGRDRRAARPLPLGTSTST